MKIVLVLDTTHSYKYKYNDGGLDECTQHTPVIVYDCLYAELMKIENNANTHTYAIKVFGETFLAALKQNEMFRFDSVFVKCVGFFFLHPVVMMSISGVGCWPLNVLFELLVGVVKGHSLMHRI